MKLEKKSLDEMRPHYSGRGGFGGEQQMSAEERLEMLSKPEPEFVLPARLHVGVWYSQSSTPRNAQNLCRRRRFFRSSLRRAAGTHFSVGKVEDAGFVAPLRRLQKHTATGQFHVVGMSSNRQ